MIDRYKHQRQQIYMPIIFYITLDMNDLHTYDEYGFKSTFIY